jgi:hypothetical protein
MRNFFTLTFKVLIAAISLNLTGNSVWAAPIPDPIYERMFPEYAEICGFGKKDHGNFGGHALLYVKGVCRDLTGDRPLVRRCTAEELTADPGLGTALSVDPVANNAWWVGTSDLDLVLFGKLSLDQSITHETFEDLIEKATQHGIYDGIWPNKKKQAKRPLALSVGRFLAGEGLGTDYALNLAREGSCWKIPLSSEQVTEIVQEANSINLALDKDHPKQWDFLANNCVHFVVNLLAKAGVLEHVPIRLPFPASLIDLEAPSTRILRIGKTIRKGIPKVTQAYKDKLIRSSLLKYHRLPFQYGTILEYIPFHSRGNFNFDSNLRWALPGQIKQLIEMENDPLLTDLKTHLEHYREQLLDAKRLFEAMPLEILILRKHKYETLEFASFYGIYEAWLVESLRDLDEKLDLAN